jgi:2-deoxy-D-gluconate 3-dehydrogenase
MPMSLFDLKGRVAIVTGGNRGIGLGIARGLAEAGAAIVVAARDAAKSEAALAELRAIGADCCFVPTRVDQEADCRRMADAALDRFGRIDILVNNAGTALLKPPQDCTGAEWDAVIRTNLTGAFLCAQAVYPTMRGQGGGKIVNMGSLASILGSRLATAYAASKGGILQLTRSLAVSWGADRIQVNAIMPGYIDSDMSKAARASNPALEPAILARTPAGRMGEAVDLAGVAVFLASAASDFITGAAIPVDGGYSVQL